MIAGESRAADGGQRIGQIVDDTAQFLCQALGVEQQFCQFCAVAVFLIEDAVFIVQITGIGVADLDLLEHIAAFESGGYETLQVIGQGDRDQLGAAVEGILCDLQSGSALCREVYFAQIGAATKCIFGNTFHSAGHRESGQLGTFFKGIVLDLTNTGCGVNVETAHLALIVKCTGFDAFNIDTCADLDRIHLRRYAGLVVALEGIAANGDLALIQFRGTVAFKGHGSQSFHVSKGAGFNGKVLRSCASDQDRSHRITTVESRTANGGDPNRNGDCRDLITVAECVGSDGGNTLGNDHLTCISHGGVQESTLGMIGQDAAKGCKFRMSFFDLNRPQAGKLIQHKVKIAEGDIEICRQGDGFHRLAPIKSVHIEFQGIGSAHFETDALQFLAEEQRILGHACHIIGDRQTFDAGIVERLGQDLIDLGRDRKVTRLASGNDFQIGGAHILAEQRAIRGCIEGFVVAFLSLVNLNGFQRFAGVECVCAHQGDGIGDLNGLDAITIGGIEGTFQDLGDCHIIVDSRDHQIDDIFNRNATGNCKSAVRLHDKLQSIGAVIGVQSHVSGNIVGLQGIAHAVGDLNAGAGRSGKPACEDINAHVACVRNRQRKVFGKCDGFLMSVFNVGNIEALGIQGDAVVLGRPIRIHHSIGIAGEHGAFGIQFAIAGSALGGVVPTGKFITIVSETFRGQAHAIAHSQIFDIECAISHAAGVILHRIGHYIQGNPIRGGFTADISDLDDVFPFSGQGNGGRGHCVHILGVGAIDSDLIVFNAQHGHPVYGVLLISQMGVHGEITGFHFFGIGRTLIIGIDCLDLHGIELALGQGQGGIGQIQPVGAGGNGLVANDDFIRDSAFHRLPGDHHTGNVHAGRCCRSGLFAGDHCFGRRIIAIGNGDDADGDIAGEARQAEYGAGAVVEGIGVSTDGNLDPVICRAGNRIPCDLIFFRIIGQMFDGGQYLIIYKYFRGRIGQTLGAGRNGDQDAAILHGAVADEEIGRGAVIKSGMYMILIAAIHGNDILLRFFHSVKNQDAVFNNESGYSVQRLVGKTSFCRLGVLFRIACHCGHADLIFARLRAGKIEDPHGGANGFVIDQNIAVRTHNRQLVRAGALHCIPADHAFRHADGGHLQFGTAVVMPKGKQCGIGSENSLIGVYIGQSLAILVHADPPTAKGIACSFRCHHTIGHAADGGDGRKGLRTFVAHIKVHRIFRNAGLLLGPAGVNGGILFHGGGIKDVGRSKFRIRIPTQEDMAFLGRIRRLLRGLAVDYISHIHRAAAIDLEIHLIGQFPLEVHGGVVIQQRDIITVDGGGGGTVFIPEEIKHQIVAIYGIGAGFVDPGTGNGEITTSA